MKMWTVEEEAARLKARFAQVNRAAFAREHKLKGGDAMVYQHITARRPMSLDAALAYAAGFGCSLAEISPRLAEEVLRAAAHAEGPAEDATQVLREAEAEYRVEPFFPRVDRDKFRQLSQAQRDGIEDWVVQQVEAYLTPAPAKSATSKKEAA